VFAHRGFAGVYPENTVPAARNAARHESTSMIEVDVVPTADGTVVCFHDDQLHETADSRGITDASGRIWETSTRTVLDATVLESGATVPRFETVLDVIPAGVGINVELKNPGCELGPPGGVGSAVSESERWRPFVESVVDCLDSVDNEILVSSFYEGALAATHEVDSGLPLAVLVRESLSWGLETARRYEAAAIHPPVNQIAGTAVAGSCGDPDIDIVAAAHEEDFAVNVWTLHSWDQADRLARAGVDGLIVDYPGVTDWLDRDE
jgi:glycerophosphoryl diester phosphodiesterase